MSFRTKVMIFVVGVVLAGLGAWIGIGALHRRWAAEGVAAAVHQEAKEEKADAKQAEERGDGGYLFRDVLERVRKPLPR
jgi:hypothetical protein